MKPTQGREMTYFNDLLNETSRRELEEAELLECEDKTKAEAEIERILEEMLPSSLHPLI